MSVTHCAAHFENAVANAKGRHAQNQKIGLRLFGKFSSKVEMRDAGGGPILDLTGCAAQQGILLR